VEIGCDDLSPDGAVLYPGECLRQQPALISSTGEREKFKSRIDSDLVDKSFPGLELRLENERVMALVTIFYVRS